MDDDTRVRPFADWLVEQGAGRTHEDLSLALRDLSAAVRDTGKKGTLTLTVMVAPFDKSNSGALVVTDQVKVRLPEHDRRRSVYFADDVGNLTKDDPMQPTFEGLREVPAPTFVEATDHRQEKHA